MAKLRGKAKEEFLKRMARGRRKAAKQNPKKKAAKRSPKKNAKTKRAKKNGVGKLTGAKKKVFLERMAKGRRRAARGGSKKWNPKRRRRRNSDDSIDAAAAKFQEFHGKPASHVIEYDQQFRYPENYAELGRLIELRFALDEDNPDFPLTKFEDRTKDETEHCLAVCTPDGRNIYFIGGDQTVDLEALDIASDKDFVTLGPCTYISYHTVKGFHDFAPITYYHSFGEEDGILPTLVYDRLNQTLFLTSGNYSVRPEGIVN